MRDIISATIGENHFLKCTTYSIARNGEGLTPCLSISIPDGLCKYWAYIDFKKPNGETFKTPRIDVSEGKIVYNIPCAVLDADGELEVQVVFQNENGEIWKSYVKEFAVRYSINATDDIPDKQDFITEAQKLVNEAVEIAKSVEERANNGEFDGKDAVTDLDYSPESENAQSGKAVAEAIANIPKVIVDKEISDTSENPVQNKAVKSYVDTRVGNIVEEKTFMELLPEFEGQEVWGVPSPSAVVNYVNNYAELKPQWELLKEVELTETVTAYSEKVDGLGDTTKGVRVALYLPPNTTLANNGITFTSSLVGSSAVAVDVTDWKSNTAETFCVFETKHNDLLWDITVLPYTKKTRQIFYDISVTNNNRVRYVKFTNSTLPIGTKIKIWGLL